MVPFAEVVLLTAMEYNREDKKKGKKKEKGKEKGKEIADNVFGCSSCGWELTYRWNQKGKTLSVLWDTKNLGH